jgi:hypothetical protein
MCRKFAEYVPEDCPPPTAVEPNGKGFRNVKANPFTKADFETHVENGKREDAEFCSRCAISVSLSLSDAVHLRKRMPKIGQFIAVADLAPEHGAWELTDRRTGHINWWPYADVERISLFKIVQEDF